MLVLFCLSVVERDLFVQDDNNLASWTKQVNESTCAWAYYPSKNTQVRAKQYKTEYECCKLRKVQQVLQL